MTKAELERAIKSKQRMQKLKAQEQASYDYILADLIGKSVARIYGANNSFPEISEVYPTLFDTTEIEKKRAERQAELSALRFKQFATSYNKKFKEEAK